MNERTSGQQSRQQSTQLPPGQLAREFGKVYTRPDGANLHVEFTIWLPELEGAEAEGWQTGVALDASASMKDWYGRNLTGTLPDHVANDYERRGWIKAVTHDGRRVRTFQREAFEDAISRGYLKFTENIVQATAQEFIGYLAGSLDADGGTTVIYWACGDGSATEVLGDFTETECRTLTLEGPKSNSFGAGTHVTPAVRYFVDRFRDAARGLYVFFTDGRLDDLDEIKRYTTILARDIQAGRRNSVKCVLIGIGDEIDERQMEELDNLETGTDVDIWDHKIAKDLRDTSEVMVELVGENQIVAPTALVYDDQGTIVARFTDGLPARASFVMPARSAFFELEVAGRRVKQSVVIGH